MATNSTLFNVFKFPWMRSDRPDKQTPEAQEHSPLSGTGIVVFSHLRWNFVWQRPQQFLSRFAENQPVLFIEEPMFDLAAGEAPRMDLQLAQANVTTMVLHLPAGLSADEVCQLRLEHARAAISEVNEGGAFDNPLLWFYSPMDCMWALSEIDGRGVVYDCMDELSLFAGAPPELVAQEKRLLSKADIVFCGGQQLCASKSAQHGNVHFFGCGVEYGHFAQAQEPGEVPEDVRGLSRPIVGWFGVIDERVDYALLEEMARKRPSWSFVLVGPVVKVDPASLPQAPNLHWIGQRDYRELPLYCRAYDVCMMPFALNDATRYINPTKALEYLATGRPVVSTPVQDVVAQYSDTVAIAGTADEFIAEIESALATRPEARIGRGIARAQASSWESTVGKMQELIQDALKRVRA